MYGAFAQGVMLAQTSPGTGMNQILAGNGRDAPIIEITTIIVANLDGSAHTFSLTHDFNGSGSTSAFALYWVATVPASSSFIAYQSNHPSGGLFLGKNGTIHFQSTTANTLTCTIYGVTSAVQDRALGGGNV
jgi:hypothetical protein